VPSFSLIVLAVVPILITVRRFGPLRLAIWQIVTGGAQVVLGVGIPLTLLQTLVFLSW